MLDPSAYRDLVRRALAEDVGSGDVTTNATVPEAARGRGILLAKSEADRARAIDTVDALRTLRASL